MHPDQHGVWERIAQSFDASRWRGWAHVEAFLDAAEPGPGRPVVDVMCGNGRHLRPGVVGVDWSRPLCRAAARHGDVVSGDATRLPFRDASFAAAVYVAGLHGIPDAAGRVASLAEVRRVLRPGAAVQVTVWSRTAPRFADQDLPDGPADVWIPWRSGGLDEQRFYHLYTPESLAADVAAAGLEVLSVGEEALAAAAPDNIVIVAKRPA